MKPENGIKEGDIVHVDFNGAQITLCNEAVVRYMPCQTGDSWVFEDTQTGFIHYVSEGCTVSKRIDRPNAELSGR